MLKVKEVWVRVAADADLPISRMVRRFMLERLDGRVWRRLPEVYATRADAERAKEVSGEAG